MVKISIVMPVYNKEHYVDKAIRSVLSQTFSEWELIIVDDGSTDNSLEICQQYKDARIHIIHTENGGVSKARNLGMDEAKGEYIAFLDSDDYLEKDYLEKLYCPKKDMIIGGLTKVNKNGDILSRIIPSYIGDVDLKIIKKTFYKEQNEAGIYGYVSSKLFARKFVKEHKIYFDKNIKLAEDYDFFLRIYACIESIYFINYTGYYYVQETINSAIGMDDERIDFYQQIRIQQRTRGFLEQDENMQLEDEIIYQKKIDGYVYTILCIASKKSYLEFKTALESLKDLVPETKNSFSAISFLILKLYCMKKIKLCYWILKCKNIIKI